MSGAVGPTGRVFAFEPNQESASRLRRHLNLNGILNVEVVEAAVAEHAGSSYFNDEEYSGRLSEAGRLIKTVCLDDYPIPDFVKMDIEGTEIRALRGGERILAGQRTVWAIEIYGPEGGGVCPKVLKGNGCVLGWVGHAELLATPKGRAERAPRLG